METRKGKRTHEMIELGFCAVLLKRDSLSLIPNLRYGLVVRIAGSHPAGPGSIPGNGNLFFTFLR